MSAVVAIYKGKQWRWNLKVLPSNCCLYCFQMACHQVDMVQLICKWMSNRRGFGFRFWSPGPCPKRIQLPACNRWLRDVPCCKFIEYLSIVDTRTCPWCPLDLLQTPILCRSPPLHQHPHPPCSQSSVNLQPSLNVINAEGNIVIFLRSLYHTCDLQPAQP